MKILTKIFFVLFFILTAANAYAVVPPITDDTQTPGPGNWQVGMALTVDEERKETRFETPVVEIDYGIGKSLEIKYQVAWLTVHKEEQGVTKNGLDDQLIGVKWRFLDEDRSGVAMSILPQVQFNSPNHSVERGIVARERTVFLLAQAEKTFGDINTVVEWGYLFNEKARDGWLYGVMLRYKVTKRLTAMAEINGGMDWDWTNQRNLFNTGLFYDLTDRVNVFVTGGRGIVTQGGGPTLLMFVGTQVKF